MVSGLFLEFQVASPASQVLGRQVLNTPTSPRHTYYTKVVVLGHSGRKDHDLSWKAGHTGGS